MNKFYFDTYALIEISKANLNYTKYSNDVIIILNNLNLLEFTYFLIREGKESEIHQIFQNLTRYHVDYDEEVLIEAAKLKFSNKKDRLSFIDCIGYCLAKKNKAKFLTGDEKFRDMENVEFVKQKIMSQNLYILTPSYISQEVSNMVESKRISADCRLFPSEKNCSLYIAGTEEEVLQVATRHAVEEHGHEYTKELRNQIRSLLKPE